MTREISIGKVKIGGGRRIAIQSMTNTDTKDVASTVSQIKRLEEAGCDIVRCAVYDIECASFIPEIKKQINIPIVADVHFDHRIAVAAIKNGADKVRINPGNIGSREKVLEVVRAARDAGVPIRVGGNTGSLPSDIQEKIGNGADALVAAALRNIEILEDAGFEDICVSLKSSDVKKTVEAYRSMTALRNYPLHLGITEAGTKEDSSVKSAMGIGSLLLDGIGDTIRVSVTGDVTEEIRIAKKILKFAGLYDEGVEIVSCPTCARCSYDVEKAADELRAYTENIKKHLKIAVMGCVVNGPGEAKDADFGMAGGNGKAVVFENGESIGTYSIDDAVAKIKNMCDAYSNN